MGCGASVAKQAPTQPDDVASGATVAQKTDGSFTDNNGAGEKNNGITHTDVIKPSLLAHAAFGSAPPPNGPPETLDVSAKSSPSQAALLRLASREEEALANQLLHSRSFRNSTGRNSTKKVSAANVKQVDANCTLSGTQAWSSGRYLVLSGEAVVVATCQDSTEPVTLATLKKGNSFGWIDDTDDWQRQVSKASQFGTCTWEHLDARIVVGDAQPLQLLKLDGQGDDGQAAARTAYLEGITKNLADLWLNTTAPRLGMVLQPSGILRAHFLTGLWNPFLDLLENHQEEMRRRKRRGYRTNDQFPLTGTQIAELKEQVAHLTDIWYGTDLGGNLSAFYRWFMKSMDLVNVTVYSMADIPTDPTPDGWAVVVDGATRTKALKGSGNKDTSYQATGGLKQKQGRSAIDNTTLVNVFTWREARVMLLGRRLRKIMCKFIALRQRCILVKLSKHLQLNLEAHASVDAPGRGHRLVRSVLRVLTHEDLRSAGINVENSFCFRELQSRGSILSGFGQLLPQQQQSVWEFVTGLLCPSCKSHHDLAPKEDSDCVFDRLVLWCRKFPGEYFEKTKERHFEVMLAGLFANLVVVVKRSAMERMTLARYFALSWTRTKPLYAYCSTQNEPKELRQSGTKEASRVRANEAPYAPLHGMSLPAGGYALDERRRGLASQKDTKYSLMMEMQWVQDPSANVENWFLTDVEKIVSEAWQLNPHGEKSMMLPGEMFVNVGQNPKIGSSIKQTQHTQCCEGSICSYPVLQLSSDRGPLRSEKLDALVDFIDIGPKDEALENCGFFIKIIAARPTDASIIEFLVDLRLRLLANFGGAEAIDFLVTALSDECGRFVILFAPIPQLEKIGSEPPDLACWANPLTGESSESAALEEARLDFGKGVGQFLVLKPALREQLLANGEDTLRRIWAFNRIPGVRAFVHQYAEEQRIFGACFAEAFKPSTSECNLVHSPEHR